jgi:prevent-host-death family protein
MTMKPKIIAAGEFKARCLKLMDRVNARKEEFVITKKGKPIAKLVPVDAGARPDIFGCLAGDMVLAGDLLRPVDGAEDWEAS